MSVCGSAYPICAMICRTRDSSISSSNSSMASSRVFCPSRTSQLYGKE